MDELQKQILAEKENVEIALENLGLAKSKNEKTVIELAAIGTFLHNIYNGIENILKRVVVAGNVEIPVSVTWHKDLLNLSLSMGIISEKTCDELYKYLTFRHFFIHAYGFMLEEVYMEDLMNDIPDVWSQFLKEIKDFKK
ncbi:MAG: hypothetical protein KAR85_06950 [Methanosarcinales archaeon]|nr:hypothetical protein [Methanosarcinales archaeon]